MECVEKIVAVGAVKQCLVPEGFAFADEADAGDFEDGSAGAVEHQVRLVIGKSAGPDAKLLARGDEVVAFFQAGVERAGEVFLKKAGDERGHEPAAFEDDGNVVGQAEASHIENGGLIIELKGRTDVRVEGVGGERTEGKDLGLGEPTHRLRLVGEAAHFAQRGMKAFGPALYKCADARAKEKETFGHHVGDDLVRGCAADFVPVGELALGRELVARLERSIPQLGSTNASQLLINRLRYDNRRLVWRTHVAGGLATKVAIFPSRSRLFPKEHDS